MANAAPLEVTLSVATHNGETINVTLTMTYPEGKGLYAINALTELAAQTEPLHREMIHRKDAATLQALGKISADPDEPPHERPTVTPHLPKK
jgi:hypothetical protein